MIQRNRIQVKIGLPLLFFLWFSLFAPLTGIIYPAVGATKTSVTANIKIGDYLYFGSFNGDMILWRVIDCDEAGNPLLFADRILTLRAFNDGRNYYADSLLRKWLNNKENGFLADSNFTSTERQAILPQKRKVVLTPMDADKKDGGLYGLNYDESGTGVQIGKALQNYDENAMYQFVTDEVFPLSVRDVVKYVYERGWKYQTGPTPQAVAEANSRPDKEDFFNLQNLKPKYYWSYWLDTPVGSMLANQRVINGRGQVLDRPVGDSRIGVRPALRLNMQHVALSKDGLGTVAKPYRMLGGLYDKPLIYPWENLSGIAIIGNDIYMGGEKLDLGPGIKPMNVRGTILVPFRTIFSKLDMKVKWIAETRTIIATKFGYTLVMELKNNEARINNVRTQLTVSPLEVKGTTYVPLRFVGEAVGQKVTYRAQ